MVRIALVLGLLAGLLGVPSPRVVADDKKKETVDAWVADWESLLKKGDTVGQARAISGLGDSDLRKLVATHIAKRLVEDRTLTGTPLAMAFKKLGADAKGAVPVLIDILKDKRSAVRGHTAICLMMIGDTAKAAVPVLIDIVGEKTEPPLLPTGVVRASDLVDQISAAKAAVFLGVDEKQASRLAGHIASLINEIGQRPNVRNDDSDVRPEPRPRRKPDLADDDDAAKKAELKLWLAVIAPKMNVGLMEWEWLKSTLENPDKMKPVNPPPPELLALLRVGITLAEFRELERKYPKQ
jgi:hypothetical protein